MNIEWRGDAPVSAKFGDIYFQQDGVAESRHVFLAGNDLPARWQDQKQFKIAELGFGTGLNFLATLQLWQSQARRPQLHYYAIELYPLSRNDMTRAHHAFPELAPQSAAMLRSYPEQLQSDWHWRHGDVELTVLQGHVSEKIMALPDGVNAWYLDGFAPATNPDMWRPELFQAMAGKSGTGVTFATFTVARAVRDAAIDAGFTLEKRKGFGKKRDMLVGCL